MPAFTGTLNSNEIYSAIYNMIISQQVFGDNIKGGVGGLVDEARVDGGLYGDTKLYYATDVLKSHAWGNDAEASNLLALDRPAAPSCQKIVLNKFRQIRLTLDNYLTKRAWADEGAFGQFNSVMMGWVRETKKVYDTTTYNAFIGTASSSTGGQAVSIDVTTAVGATTGEEANRLEAQAIAQGIAKLMRSMKDISRDFNDYGYLRSYSEDEIKIIWNGDFVDKITNLDLPTIFHKDGLLEFKNVLPARYFGTVNSGTKQGDGTTVRSLIEQDISGHHYFAGDLIGSSDTAPAGTSYTVDADVICKVVVKLPPYMSAFEVGTSFYNPRSLTENHYLTFGHNTLEYLKNYPMITVSKI